MVAHSTQRAKHHRLRGSGVVLVVGLVVFAVGLAATSLPTWLGG